MSICFISNYFRYLFVSDPKVFKADCQQHHISSSLNSSFIVGIFFPFALIVENK